MWFTLESIPGLNGNRNAVERKVGARLAAFKSLCLQPSDYQVKSVRCPRCGCNHRILLRQDGTGGRGICQCDPPHCPEIPLGLPDVTTLELSDVRLGRALCKAFGLATRHARLPMPNTWQFGAWSTDAVPAIITIQVQNSVFRRAVGELAAHLRQPFMLFAPTSDFLDAPARSILENHGAGFFPLDTSVQLTDHGTLQATRPPGELFARFTPQPKETDLDMLARVYALVEKLDTDKPMPPPSLLTVFRLYCVKEWSMARIANKFECDRTNIGRRLKLIRQLIGMDPAELRRLSPHIAKIEESLSDSRAARIDRRSAMDEE